ncbi:two-component response regulator [Fulvivirga imtechensis AK7]|uniref:Two-component response regulator n=1 Tax=Fulvivirga imtechensis AK7 TaxID=1237149 RepID=L8JW17_9BACT|nr:response regulator [Fulvivirga imtechensis]ELR72388.1 two-component response regulator [Fulvivirga imtechensis AK7]
MSRKVILILDDEPTILDAIKYQVSKTFGGEYEYELAESGEEGLEILEELIEEGLDMLIAISDWLMPGMKGDDFLIELHNRFPNCVKIMVTGQADQQSIDRAFKEANLHKVIYKPWVKEELVDAIRSGVSNLTKPSKGNKPLEG